MLISLTLCAAVSTSVITYDEPDPILGVDSQDLTQELVQSQSQTLLLDARQRKLSGKPGYGDQYRKSAWAAYEEDSKDPARPWLVLQELIDSPESLLDVFDAYRMMGQMHFSNFEWGSSIDFYTLANLFANANPAIATDHPQIMVSVLQGLSLALRANDDPAAAAQIDIQLRDHPCGRIPRSTRRGAALSAAQNFLLAHDKDACENAWALVESQFPEKLADSEGVLWRMEKARALAQFDGQFATHLEAVWNHEGIRDYDTSLHVALELSGAWLDSAELPMRKEFAHQVLLSGWETIQQHEAEWINSYDGSQSKIDSLRNMTRMILRDLLVNAMDLELWQEALPIAEAYNSRYGAADNNAAILLYEVQAHQP